jgi:hypothetical protein
MRLDIIRILYFFLMNHYRMTAWTDTVKKTFHMNRKTNKNYQFKDALKDASKFYKKGTGVVSEVASKGTGAVVKVARKGSSVAKKAAKKVKRAVTSKRGRKSKKSSSRKKRKSSRRR